MPDRWKGRGEGKESRPANQAAFTTGGGEEGEASKWVPVGLINMRQSVASLELCVGRCSFLAIDDMVVITMSTAVRCYKLCHSGYHGPCSSGSIQGPISRDSDVIMLLLLLLCLLHA